MSRLISSAFLSSASVVGVLALSGLLTACSDYNLVNPGKPNDNTDVTPPGDQPDIQVEPSTLDFGSVLRNCPSAPQTVTVTNIGAAILDVTDLALDNSKFSIDWDGAAFQLAPGESRDFQVGFTPDAYMAYTTDLLVDSSDPDQPQVTVPAQGAGDETALFEEGFTQEFYSSVDVLWVVDNSGSMDQELNQVQLNFESFIEQFVALGLDYHLAVITTDMDSPAFQGRFQGGVISPDDADPVSEFLAATNQGASGSGDERSMDAIQTALTEPLLSGGNAGFLRDDAALATIVLSDENDSSRIMDGSFQSWLQGLKADSAQVSFNAIVGDPTSSTRWLGGCSNWVGSELLQADAGDRYVDMANATGGIWRSICYENYDETLAHISLSSAGMVTTYQLSQMPTNFGLIQVYVNDVQYYYSLTDGWMYNSDDNSITFHGSALPGPGDRVVIQYPIDGECN